MEVCGPAIQNDEKPQSHETALRYLLQWPSQLRIDFKLFAYGCLSDGYFLEEFGVRLVVAVGISCHFRDDFICEPAEVVECFSRVFAANNIDKQPSLV